MVRVLTFWRLTNQRTQLRGRSCYPWKPTICTVSHSSTPLTTPDDWAHEAPVSEACRLRLTRTRSPRERPVNKWSRTSRRQTSHSRGRSRRDLYAGRMRKQMITSCILISCFSSRPIRRPLLYVVHVADLRLYAHRNLMNAFPNRIEPCPAPLTLPFTTSALPSPNTRSAASHGSPQLGTAVSPHPQSSINLETAETTATAASSTHTGEEEIRVASSSSQVFLSLRPCQADYCSRRRGV